MNRLYKTLIICTLIGLLTVSGNLFAGNKDRSGQAGAQHLLIDPWASSAGWGTAGVAEIRGMESIYSNIAGMAFVNKTQFGFSRTQYLVGSGADISINAFAICQSLNRRNKNTGEVKNFGVIGVSVYSMGFGDIDITTTEQPEGNLGTFSPKLNYIGVHYAKTFNDYIHAGVSVKIINESISDLSATGIAIDAGVQYLTGPYENFKIGVTMKNIGLPISYKGDGISLRGVVTATDHELTLETRSAEYELPALLTLGISYDFLIWGDEYKDLSKEHRKDEGLTRNDADHRITVAASFTANSYSNDLYAIGVEYGFLQYIALRAGYTMEAGMWNPSTCKTWYAGPSAGISVGIPLVKKDKGDSKLFLDYGYRFTNVYKGNHYLSLKVVL